MPQFQFSSQAPKYIKLLLISHYSFRTNTWKDIDYSDFPYNFYFDTQGVTLNGAPHWVLRREEYDMEAYSKSVTVVLVYFDPAKEDFYELPLPCMLDKDSKFELGVLGGCLSLTYDPNGSHFETCVMKKYGVEESWEKLFVIPYFEERLRPLCFTKKGDILKEVSRKKIVIYNLLNNSYKRTVVSNIEPDDSYYSHGFELGVRLVQCKLNSECKMNVGVSEFS